MILEPAAIDKLRRRFCREVRVQEQLGGDEVLAIEHFELEGDEPWFVMPLAEKVLDERIRDGEGHPFDALADVLSGLEAIHDLGYAHRDLNPRNILLHDGRWKLADFGAVLPPSDQTVTMTEGTVIYTENYCAPEQRLSFHEAGAPADIYAFGCILHDVFAGSQRTPYTRHSCAGPVGPIIEKCTEVDPMRRLHLADLRSHLLEVFADIEGELSPPRNDAAKWVSAIELAADWSEEDYDDFVRYFHGISEGDIEAGYEDQYVDLASTPFLTRMPAEFMKVLACRQDGATEAVIDKYCSWAGSTAFKFHFADTICGRLIEVFDHGGTTSNARAFVALVKLGSSHNRWYVMSRIGRRCMASTIDENLGRRLAMELQTDGGVNSFRRCIREREMDTSGFSAPLARLAR